MQILQIPPKHWTKYDSIYSILISIYIYSTIIYGLYFWCGQPRSFYIVSFYLLNDHIMSSEKSLKWKMSFTWRCCLCMSYKSHNQIRLLVSSTPTKKVKKFEHALIDVGHKYQGTWSSGFGGVGGLQFFFGVFQVIICITTFVHYNACHRYSKGGGLGRDLTLNNLTFLFGGIKLFILTKVGCYAYFFSNHLYSGCE